MPPWHLMLCHLPLSVKLEPEDFTTRANPTDFQGMASTPAPRNRTAVDLVLVGWVMISLKRRNQSAQSRREDDQTTGIVSGV